MDPSSELHLLDATNDEDVLLWMISNNEDLDEGWKDVEFNLNDLSNDACKSMFRFDKQDLYTLCRYLDIPERVVAENQSIVPGTDALCMLLRRFSYPNRLCDLQYTFGRSQSEISVFCKKHTESFI